MLVHACPCLVALVSWLTCRKRFRNRNVLITSHVPGTVLFVCLLTHFSQQSFEEGVLIPTSLMKKLDLKMCKSRGAPSEQVVGQNSLCDSAAASPCQGALSCGAWAGRCGGGGATISWNFQAFWRYLKAILQPRAFPSLSYLPVSPYYHGSPMPPTRQHSLTHRHRDSHRHTETHKHKLIHRHARTDTDTHRQIHTHTPRHTQQVHTL